MEGSWGSFFLGTTVVHLNFYGLKPGVLGREDNFLIWWERLAERICHLHKVSVNAQALDDCEGEYALLKDRIESRVLALSLGSATLKGAFCD